MPIMTKCGKYKSIKKITFLEHGSPDHTHTHTGRRLVREKWEGREWSGRWERLGILVPGQAEGGKELAYRGDKGRAGQPGVWAWWRMRWWVPDSVEPVRYYCSHKSPRARRRGGWRTVG